VGTYCESGAFRALTSEPGTQADTPPRVLDEFSSWRQWAETTPTPLPGRDSGLQDVHSKASDSRSSGMEVTWSPRSPFMPPLLERMKASGFNVVRTSQDNTSPRPRCPVCYFNRLQLRAQGGPRAGPGPELENRHLRPE
jgi:hypothetical protein